MSRTAYVSLLIIVICLMLAGAALDDLTKTAWQGDGIFVPTVTLDPSQVWDLRP